MIHSFLLIGQSNMAGRGFVDEVPPIENQHIKVLRNGRWQQMYVPVNGDRPFSGINLAESFADSYQKEHHVDVGLIPCADGGTSLEQWEKGGLLYDNAIYQTKLAERTSNLAGVLWHQGEADCSEELYPLYEKKFTAILNGFKEDLNLNNVPFLIGALGDFLKDCPLDENLKNYIHVNTALEKIARENAMVGFVSAKGLTANPDCLHFNAKSLRQFGIRYFAEFKKLEDRDKIFVDKSSVDNMYRKEMELL